MSGVNFAGNLFLTDAKIARPCLSISPLLSTHGTFGTGFSCKHQDGHDGDHAQTITWMGHDNVEIGRMELTWTLR